MDLDQPKIIVPLVSISSDSKKGMYKYMCPWLFFASLLTVFVNESVTREERACPEKALHNTHCYFTILNHRKKGPV